MSFLVVYLTVCLVLVGILPVSASDLCGENLNNNTQKIVNGMQRTLKLFKENSPGLTVDVILSLMITKSFLNAIPIELRVPAVGKIIAKSDVIIHEFQLGKGDHSKSKQLIPFVLNSSLWSDAVLPLRNSEIMKFRHSRNKFQLNDNQEKDAAYFALQSEICLHEIFNCNIPLRCVTFPRALEYVPTHTLLFLNIARASPCVKDKIPHYIVDSMQTEICQRMAFQNDALLLNEDRDLKTQDIFLERIALCGMNGFVEFLRKVWLLEMLSWERRDGCFGSKKRSKRNDSIMGSDCHSHPTSVGIAALAFYLRGILMLCF